MVKWFCILGVLAIMAAPGSAPAETRIKCASTTSTQNSGLFDYLLPIFAKEDRHPGGRGGRGHRGRHRDREKGRRRCGPGPCQAPGIKAVEEGYFVNRHDVMYNDFVIIGPPNDPAKIKGLKSATEAFKKIAESGSPFVSRGDKSGTNIKELAIWKQAGIDPKGQKWYMEVGQGMEKTQRVANEKRAYTLTDRGTWLATKDKDKLDMAVVLEGDPVLFNQYGVMAVNPEKHKEREK